MPLVIIAHEGDKVLADTSGTFLVIGVTFNDGNLELDLGGVAVNAKLTPRGEVASVGSHALRPFANPPPEVPVTMTRVAR